MADIISFDPNGVSCLFKLLGRYDCQYDIEQCQPDSHDISVMVMFFDQNGVCVADVLKYRPKAHKPETFTVSFGDRETIEDLSLQRAVHSLLKERVIIQVAKAACQG